MNNAESSRLKTLQSMEILDTPPDPILDQLTRIACHIFDVPISLISLLDEDRQWFKSNTGIERVRQTPREWAFCDHAIKAPNLFLIRDAKEDQRFVNNPLVINEPFIRFYAGVPLSVTNELALGTLCIIDREPRELSETEKETLRQLAYIAEQWITKNYLYQPNISLVKDDWEIPETNGRSKLIKAAIHLLNHRQTLSLRDIANEASISLSNLQHHFPSKLDLYLAINTTLSDLWSENLSNANTLEDLAAKLVTSISSGIMPAFVSMSQLPTIQPQWLKAKKNMILILDQKIKGILRAKPNVDTADEIFTYLLGCCVDSQHCPNKNAATIFYLLNR